MSANDSLVILPKMSAGFRVVLPLYSREISRSTGGQRKTQEDTSPAALMNRLFSGFFHLWGSMSGKTFVKISCLVMINKLVAGPDTVFLFINNIAEFGPFELFVGNGAPQRDFMFRNGTDFPVTGSP